MELLVKTSIQFSQSRRPRAIKTKKNKLKPMIATQEQQAVKSEPNTFFVKKKRSINIYILN